jgi:acyl-CoA thioester hydrolase
VIPPDPDDRHIASRQSLERRQNTKRVARNDRPPLEPEIEEVAVDHERTRMTVERLEEYQKVVLCLVRHHAEVMIRYDVAWSSKIRMNGHAESLSRHRLNWNARVTTLDLFRGRVAGLTSWGGFFRLQESRNEGTSLARAEEPASEFRLRVRYSETDRMGIVYHANYLIWCEAGRTELMRRAGCVYSAIEARGFALAVAAASLRYHAPARYDDEIIVETTVTRVRSRTIEFDYVVLNAATRQKLVTASTTLVSLGPDGGVTALPEDLRRVLEATVR